jgi:hypothetical protein
MEDQLAKIKLSKGKLVNVVESKYKRKNSLGKGNEKL